jgi:sulfide:quinone oxidoreductase
MKKDVLILGGGIAGIEAAIFLKKYGFDVTLISNRDYLYVYPVSIWIPIGDIDFKDACLDLNELSKIHGFELIIDEITEIKSKENIVLSKSNSYSYNELIVAIGADKMKHKGIENTLSICGKPEESLKIKEEISKLIQKGSGKIAMGFGGNPKDTSGVRGGPAFEVLFNVDHKLRKLGIRDNFELTFFAPMPKPGARMGENAVKIVDEMFKRLNIKKQAGKKIKEFVKDGIIFEDDSKLESDFTMFIPAGKGHHILANSDLPLNEAGFIKIKDHCKIEGLNNAYAIGDCAAMQGPEWKAKQGHIAEVMAKQVAYNIKAKRENKKDRKKYIHHLNILCVMDSGNGAAFVYRDHNKTKMLPLPIIGHWLKKGWGWYYKNSKLKKIPRIAGI